MALGSKLLLGTFCLCRERNLYLCFTSYYYQYLLVCIWGHHVPVPLWGLVQLRARGVSAKHAALKQPVFSRMAPWKQVNFAKILIDT